MFTSDNPYGYWIGKNDIIPVVSEESHCEVAIEKILKRPTKSSSCYAVMFRLGYVRVVNQKGGGYCAEYWKRAKLSKLQKQFIQDAEYKETVDYSHSLGLLVML